MVTRGVQAAPAFVALALLAGSCGARTEIGAPPPRPPGPELALGWGFTCLLDADAVVRCWGESFFDHAGAPAATAVVPGVAGAVQISASGDDACALLADGTLRCWGANEYGQLALPLDVDTMSSPQTVPDLPPLAAVSTSTLFSCGLGRDGSLRCFGDVPPDHLPPPGTPPIEIEQPAPAVVVAASNDSPMAEGHACILDASGGAWCFGLNNGRLGDGTMNDRSTPVKVVAPVAFAQIAPGGEHTCALDTAGDAWCWGHNGQGRLGDGTTSDRLVPTRVVGLAKVAHIASGGYHTCALLRDASVWCWGANDEGQLGRGVVDLWLTPNPTPQRVVGLADVVALGAGVKHNCAVLRDASVWCWGLNDFDQLGVTDPYRSAVPVRAAVP